MTATVNSKLVSIGVSKSYASQIASGARSPSLSLAIKIYRELGMKLGPIADASKTEIATLEKISARAA